MIISPPFLPDRLANETDDAFVTRAMTASTRGKFPVSYYRQWHGGIHLQAPTADTPVRAIADGRIVYLRQPTARPDNQATLEQHPLYIPNIGWTDNGCIVIRHQTEIGENITITYYSIYMHLNRIESGLAQGNNIHRKTKLGSAGRIYDQENLIHFEIIAADDQIENMIGALTLNRNGANYHTNQQGHITHYISQHGRTASCFGNMYFYLPADTPTYNATHNINRYTHTATGNTLGQALYLEMKYHGGNCTFTAYDENGIQIGQPITTNNNSPRGSVHEYNLFAQSSQVCSNMPTAGFELLRFGRVLGTEALNPANTQHYRQIPTANGNTWVNLNTDAIRKYSDADFPFWKGWSVVEDDTNNDSRCDSAIVTAILDNGTAGSFTNLTDEQKQARLSEETIQKKLKKIFYKFPTEWQNANFETRFNWLRTPIDQGGRALNNEQFTSYQSHVQAQTFWETANLEGIEANHWHCPPIEFIKHFRQCGWLSQSELKQIIPRQALRTEYRRVNGVRTVLRVNWEGVPRNNGALIPQHYRSLNKMMRKYCINTPLRMASFLANSIQETRWFGSLEEGVDPNNLPSYHPWHGRGFLQLTFPGNYREYWLFRGRSISPLFNNFITNFNNQNHSDASNPRLQQYFTWRDQLIAPDNSVESLLTPSDSAGHYWASQSRNMNEFADQPHIIERISVAAVERIRAGQYRSVGQKIYYRSPSFWRVSAQINLPASVNNVYSINLNGFDQRCSVYGYAIAILTEIKLPDDQGNLTIEFPEGYERRPI